MLVRLLKVFPQFVEKIEKLKLSLSKQRNKMLKMKSEMLKTRKKAKQSSSGNFPGNFQNPGKRKTLEKTVNVVTCKRE